MTSKGREKREKVPERNFPFGLKNRSVGEACERLSLMPPNALSIGLPGGSGHATNGKGILI